MWRMWLLFDPRRTLVALFTFLFAFDFNSVIERKNPLGLVEAFCQAFEPGEGPVLVLKSINGTRRIADFERLAMAMRPYLLRPISCGACPGCQSGSNSELYS